MTQAELNQMASGRGNANASFRNGGMVSGLGCCRFLFLGSRDPEHDFAVTISGMSWESTAGLVLHTVYADCSPVHIMLHSDLAWRFTCLSCPFGGPIPHESSLLTMWTRFRLHSRSVPFLPVLPLSTLMPLLAIRKLVSYSLPSPLSNTHQIVKHVWTSTNCAITFSRNFPKSHTGVYRLSMRISNSPIPTCAKS